MMVNISRAQEEWVEQLVFTQLSPPFPLHPMYGAPPLGKGGQWAPFAEIPTGLDVRRLYWLILDLAIPNSLLA